MKLLLDTHCLIWTLADSPALSASAREAIASADEVWFSDTSFSLLTIDRDLASFGTRILVPK